MNQHSERMVHARVFFDITIDGQANGRIEMELMANTPLTSENFKALCTGEKGQDMTFKGSSFHRVIPGFMAQGGDIRNHNGTGGASIYINGGTFADEKFINRHEGRGILSMANIGPNTNHSQFSLCFGPTPNLDYQNCVFGKVVGGDDVLLAIENNATDANDKPVKPIVIADCGQLAELAGVAEPIETVHQQADVNQATLQAFQSTLAQQLREQKEHQEQL